MDTEELVGAFVDLADTLVDDFDVTETLQVLADRCVQLVGAAAAGLLLADEHGVLRVAVSSSERALLLELFQLQSAEGPCLDCYRSGEHLAAAESRWPQFAPRAVTAGYVGVHAIPMRLRGEVLGAMNLFASSPESAVAPRGLAVARALTDVATIAIVQDRAARKREVLTAQLQTALDSRVVIEQAKGLVAGRLDLGVEESFELLRSFARSTNRRLSDLVQDVVAGRVDARYLDSSAK